jgi:hypothetical protein
MAAPERATGGLSALIAVTTVRSGRVIAVGDAVPFEGAKTRRIRGLGEVEAKEAL